LRTLWPGIQFSSVWASKAVEVTDQDDFLNAVALFETNESPEEIITKLQAIEASLKKSVPFRYGPRTIDLDLLLVDYNISKKDPILPHPKMHERRFVLEPLAEVLSPATQLPHWRRSIAELLTYVQDQQCERMTLSL
jgi:2-amino-4-hydroxy-6-hydroxymethyldihydropteridine diphosphokinase